MRKVQSQPIKLNQLPISNELIMYSNFKVPRKTANVAEVWDENVADFFMSIYPESLNLGANISDLQQRANVEAYTGIHTVAEFMHFLDDMMAQEKEEEEK